MSIFTHFLQKKVAKEYFLTLGVEEHRIRAIIAQIKDEELTVIGKGEENYKEGVNEVETADAAISQAEENLDKDEIVEKVVFSLPAYFIENDKVKPEYLAKLKKISKDLNLKPCGFIEYSSAISFYLEKEEGSPPTLLLLYIGKKKLITSFIRVGKVHQSLTVEIKNSISTDFESIINKFDTEILPSRLLLYDESEDLERVKEELLRLSWHKYSSFLHTPKVEILPSNSIFDALIQAAGSSFIKEYTIQRKKLFPDDKNDLIDKDKKVDFKTPLSETHSTSHQPAHIKSEKDLHHKSEETKSERSMEEDTFGFIHGQKHILEEIQNAKKDNISIPQPDSNIQLVDKKEVHDEIHKKTILPHFKKFIIPKISFPFSKLALFISLIILILGFFGSLTYYLTWTIPKSKVSLITYPVFKTEEIEVVFTKETKKPVDGKNYIIITDIEEQVSGSKKASTTGKNKVGDKAHGEVTIYNKTLGSKTFPKGTIIKASSLQFTLNDDTTVASASDTGEGLAFGKSSVNVSAISIGPDGNLPNDTQFTFKDFPETSYTAKNINSFTGGTSREVLGVSKEDQTQLETILAKELNDKAKQQVKSKLNSEEIILDELTETKVMSKKFDHDIGDEAKELTLDLTVKINTYSFHQEDLYNISLQDSNSFQNNQFTQDNKRTTVNITDTKIDKSGEIKARVNIIYYLIPKIDKNTILSNIAGKKYDQLAKYLKSVNNIAGFKVINDSTQFFLKNRLPNNLRNITLNVITY